MQMWLFYFQAHAIFAWVSLGFCVSHFQFHGIFRVMASAVQGHSKGYQTKMQGLVWNETNLVGFGGWGNYNFNTFLTFWYFDLPKVSVVLLAKLQESLPWSIIQERGSSGTSNPFSRWLWEYGPKVVVPRLGSWKPDSAWSFSKTQVDSQILQCSSKKNCFH